MTISHPSIPNINDGISGIGSRAHIPPIADATHRQDIGGKSRINPGTWTPFLDWDDIHPGNRGRTKINTYELYDAPLGISLEIEESGENLKLSEQLTQYNIYINFLDDYYKQQNPKPLKFDSDLSKKLFG